MAQVGAQNTDAPAGSAPAAAAAVGIVDDIYDYINFNVIGDSSSPEPTMSGSNLPQTAVGYTDAVLRLIENKEFLATEVVEYTKKTNPGAFLTYFTAANELSCKRDVREYVDAVCNDLIYTGNYKALVAAKYYEVAVTGSLTQDMFYLRNGTGLRNCTLQGLTGTLGAANAYGTQRPTAGAYASLDPGWGPAHEDVWITNKSPYVQNVSTFGTGCVGLKVDGALHNGGNDSVVANDFTQILSDGIGFWVTNLGRSELVSVFTYYNHIGYLAENGGKVRATNGNNSYGKFGSVSEGGDATETPITCTVDNKSTDATIGNTFTDGNRILAMEYTNAGTNYTTAATLTISGDGYGITGTTATIRNGGVYEIRLNETVTSPESNYGGDGYSSATNVAQNGTDKTITISNTDTALAAELTGLAIWLTEGLGAGQYGYIVGFNAGTKATKVARPSFTTFSVTAATASNDRFTCADSSTLDVNMPIMFSGTAFGGVTTTATNPTIYYVLAKPTGTTFTISTTPGGTVFDVTSDAAGTMTLHKAGWDYLVNTTCTNTTVTTDLITCASNAALYVGASVQFDGTTFGGINPYTQYYVVNITGATQFKVSTSLGGSAVTLSTAAGTMTVRVVEPVLDGTTKYEYAPRIVVSASPSGVTAIARAVVTTEKISSIRIIEPGSGYVSAPTVTIVDPSNTVEAPVQVFIGDGALGQPTFTNRGLSYLTAVTTITETGVQRTVSGITNANPGVVTTLTAHTYTDGQKVTFANVAGMFQINSGIWYYVDVLTPTTFALYVDQALTIPLNTTSYGVYVASAGTVTEFAGFRNSLQSGSFIQVQGLSQVPQAGSNVEFASLPGNYYKLVTVQNLLGTQYPFTALLQVSPEIAVGEAPAHGDTITIKIRYSQIRLTGHDFLDIGTGGFASTNYPGIPLIPADSEKETVEGGGGRVFFTSTDQDGNFRVGDLFSVEQSTGIATLNADAFNISGLQELQLGELVLGGTSASINEFSTDGTMAANSDQIVPTQRAIRTYISSQIGGGASSLNVNQITAGLITIFSNTIETTTGVTINFDSPVNFTAGIRGTPVALGLFLQG